MRCPACRAPATETDAACRQCGFSLEVADRSFGPPPVLQKPIADLSGVLGSLSKRRAAQIIAAVERRFPQISIAVVLMDVPQQAPIVPYAFWLFNRGSLSSAVEKGGENRLVMLLIDTSSDRAITMMGYGLEPFLQENYLQACLQAAHQPLVKKRYAQAIESFARELDRQLVEVCQVLPKQYGLVDAARWLDACAPGEGQLGMAENLY